MELREYWRIVRRRWWILVVLTLLTIALSAWQLKPWQRPPAHYNASMRFLLGVAPEDAAATEPAYDARYYAWLTSEYLVDDFSEVLHSAFFAQNVSKRLPNQPALSPGVIQSSTATGVQHRIIGVTLSWGDHNELSQLADAVVAELTENAAGYFRQLGTEPVLVTLLDPPNVSEALPSVRSRIEFPLRVALGFVIGLGLVFLLEYLDTTVRQRSELEAMGLEVLAEIPGTGRGK
jgi:capsular polysaccharide biosynthesis protein